MSGGLALQSARKRLSELVLTAFHSHPEQQRSEPGMPGMMASQSLLEAHAVSNAGRACLTTEEAAEVGTVVAMGAAFVGAVIEGASTTDVAVAVEATIEVAAAVGEGDAASGGVLDADVHPSVTVEASAETRRSVMEDDADGFTWSSLSQVAVSEAARRASHRASKTLVNGRNGRSSK